MRIQKMRIIVADGGQARVITDETKALTLVPGAAVGIAVVAA